MNKYFKRATCKEHRVLQLLKSLNDVLKGKSPPEYMKARGDKLKKVRGCHI
jgi:hypothetical protein